MTLVEWPEAGKDRLGAPTWLVGLDHESLQTRRLEIYAMTEDACRRWEES